MYHKKKEAKDSKPNKAYIPCIAEIGKAPLVEKNVRVNSSDKTAEATIEQDIDDARRINIVPMDDCVIEVVWSFKHERLIASVREMPGRGDE